MASSLACEGAEIFNFESKLKLNFPTKRKSECRDPPEDEASLHTTSNGIRPVEVELCEWIINYVRSAAWFNALIFKGCKQASDLCIYTHYVNTLVV